MNLVLISLGKRIGIVFVLVEIVLEDDKRKL